MPPWDWRGFVAVILAIGAAISVTALCIGAVVQSEQVSPQGAALITGALGAIVGAVAVYVGGNRAADQTGDTVQALVDADHAVTPPQAAASPQRPTEAQPAASEATRPPDMRGDVNADDDAGY